MSIPSKVTFWIDNDLYIKVEGLHDGLDPAFFFDTATVTATLKDRDGITVPGVDAVVLSYVAASNGNYLGTVQETFGGSDAFLGGGYTLYITADQGGIIGNWRIPADIKIRKS